MRFKQTVSQKKRQKHIPLRRCVVCRKTAAKSELLRFYRDDKGDWQLDLKQQQGSRGMWLCNNSHECYDIKRLKNFFGKDTKRIVEEIKLINKIQELKTPVKGG